MNTKVLLLPIILLTVGVYQLKEANLALDIAQASSKAVHTAKVAIMPPKPSASPLTSARAKEPVYAVRSTQNTEKWRPLVKKYFLADQVDNVLKIMACESAGDQTAIGDKSLTFNQNGVVYGYSVGLMQIRQLPGRPATEWLLIPENNVAYAAGMWRAQSAKPWTCAKKLGLVR